MIIVMTLCRAINVTSARVNTFKLMDGPIDLLLWPISYAPRFLDVDLSHE